MRFYSTLLSLLFAVLSNHVSAQGSWLPAGADYSYPRTLCKSTQLDSVVAILGREPFSGLYSEIYESISEAVPANIVNADRGNRAAMAKNAAFILLLQTKVKKESPESLDQSEQNVFLSRCLSLMADINTSVDPITLTSPSAYEQWQWRSKELINYLTAYDLLKGAGISDSLLKPSKKLLQQFAGKLYTESNRAIMGHTFFNSVFNNHTLMTASALGTAAVVLNDAQDPRPEYQPANWISCALWNIENVLWKSAQRQSEPDKVAGYAEGPYYFRYAFANCLPFFRAMGHFLPDQSFTYTYNNSAYSIANPYFDKRYELLYTWIKNIRMPDGRLPAIDDTYMDTGMPELALTGKPEYIWQMDFSRFSPKQANSLAKQLTFTYDLRADYIAACLQPARSMDTDLTVTPASGDIVFRSGSNAGSTYFHLQAENGRSRTGGGGHNQADETSFILYSKGQLLALDPGYISYDRRGEVGEAPDHNMILVDGEGPVTGTPGNAGGADVFSQEVFHQDGLSHAQVTTSYSSTALSRDVLFVRDRYFLLADFAHAASPHSYTWQLHGYGLAGGDSATGQFYDYSSNGKAVWKKNGVKLLAHAVNNNLQGVYGAHTAEHELTYNKTENHTVFSLSTGKTLDAGFLTLVQPFVKDSVQSETIKQDKQSGIRIKDSIYRDFAFSKNDTGQAIWTAKETGLKNNLITDAAFGFISQDSLSLRKQIYLTSSRNTAFDNISFKTSHPVSLFLSEEGAGRTTGYVGDSVKLVLHSGFYVVAQGDHLQSSSFNAADSTVTLQFSSAGQFHLEPAQEPLSIHPAKPRSAFQLFPNPADGFIEIKFDRGADQMIRVLDMSGKEVKRVSVNKETLNIFLDLRELAPGIYTVNNGLVSEKLLIER